ncbi:hypothetical protein ACX348_001580 [Enterococcus hirae]|nr:hypothetical protein [Enterococcus hirae]EMF0131248.1 hypothetical protein [Enterococcus hirae]EMF0450349.1 hypothetical protein [Enterococcus hirae]
MDYGRFWQIAEECLGNTIINDEFANHELWKKLKEKTKDDFKDLVFHQEKVK